MWTNYGRFISASQGGIFQASAGSQVSIFALEDGIRMNSRGLKFPLQNVIFDNWWKATLNECSDESFELIFDSGNVIIFIGY
jgi:thiamine pyrophosphokinase